jgi:hypothetical protein
MILKKFKKVINEVARGYPPPGSKISRFRTRYKPKDRYVPLNKGLGKALNKTNKKRKA